MNFRERKEFKVFRKLLQSAPGLEARLMESEEDQITTIADLVCSSIWSCIPFGWICVTQIQKGANGARADDMKGMKGAIVDWITLKGQSLNPHIPHNVKVGRGFNHEQTRALLCPAGLDWNNIEYVSPFITRFRTDGVETVLSLGVELVVLILDSYLSYVGLYLAY